MGHSVGTRFGAVFALALGGAALAAACADPVGASPAPAPATTSTGVVVPVDACSTWRKAPNYPSAPDVARVGGVLPPRVLERAAAEGVGSSVPFAAYYDPCAARVELLVVRVHGGAWCGTCAWHAKHTNELFDFAEAKDALVVDLVTGDRTNHPATKEAAIAFADTFQTKARAVTLADPDFSLRTLLPAAGGASPLYIVVDRRSMIVLGTFSNPDATAFRNGVRTMLDPKRAPEPETLVDGMFHPNEWDLLTEMTVPGAPPPDPTNHVADDAKAAAFGRALFSDAKLSPSGTVACSTCHDPSKHFSDGLPLGVGLKTGGRRTPPIALAAHSPFQFWDGRTDTLWAQALGPLENEAEHGSSRVFVARYVATQYSASYNQIFPADPLPELDTLPMAGKPGDAAYDALPTQIQRAVTRVFVNVGKAIEAYERTLRVKGNRFDAYMAGDRASLTVLEKEGLSMFMQQGCAQCHWGPRWTDDAFHNVRLPGRTEGPVDEGRLTGVALLKNAEFSSHSVLWSDAPSQTPFAEVGALSERGAYKTPSLRGVANLSFFGHAGASSDLRDVLQVYGTGGLDPADPRAIGSADPWLVQFGFTAQWGIPQFLSVMTADVENP